MRTGMGQATTFAFLVYAPWRQRRADNSYEGNDNIGAEVVRDMLTRAGYAVTYTSPECAHRYDVVLVSLTSTMDMYAYYRAVAPLTTWQPGARTFTVLAGGFGMQNPTAIRRYVDFAAFGRVDDWLLYVVHSLTHGATPEHASLMDMRDPQPVTIAQAPRLYPHTVHGWSETFTGCPLKCKFCHYTYARQHQGSDEAYSSRQYVQTTLTGGGTPEVTWDQLLDWPKKAGRIRVAIDGSSYRLRKLYGKNITNDDLIRGVEQVGSYEGTTTLLVYNIGNFPSETATDRLEMEEVLAQARPRYRVIVVLHTTPFRPSLATPMQWEAANLDYDWSQHRQRVVVERPTLRVVHSYTLESSASHFLSLLAERCTPDEDWLFHNIALSARFSSLRVAEQLDAIRSLYDTRTMTDARDIDGPPPYPLLHGYLSTDVLRRIAHKMRAQVADRNPIRPRLARPTVPRVAPLRPQQMALPEREGVMYA